MTKKTSNGFPYPELTDSADGPGAFKALATAIESWISRAPWSTTVADPNLPGWSVEGSGVLVSPLAGGGNACSLTTTVRRTDGAFTIGAGAWFVVGAISPAPGAKSGTVGSGVGQTLGQSYEVQVNDSGQLRIWSKSAISVSKGTALNIAVNWLAN